MATWACSGSSVTAYTSTRLQVERMSRSRTPASCPRRSKKAGSAASGGEPGLQESTVNPPGDQRQKLRGVPREDSAPGGLRLERTRDEPRGEEGKTDQQRPVPEPVEKVQRGEPGVHRTETRRLELKIGR